MAKTTKSSGASRGGSPDNQSDDVLLRGARTVIKDGAIEFAADGSSAPDTVIKRAAGGGLNFTGLSAVDDLAVADDLTVGGDATVTGTTTALGYFGAGGNFGIGSGASEGAFFGATAIAKPTVAGITGGNTALANLLVALENLGLINDTTTAS